MANIGAFFEHDTRILSNLPSDLSIADIYAIDLLRLCLQKTVGKATGRDTAIQTDFALGLHIEGFERLSQLFTSA